MNMKSKKIGKKTIYKAGMIAFDAFAVVFSYWFALIARFYIAFQFRAGADRFVMPLMTMIPFYAVACIVIFWVFGLYNTLWKVAGIRDLNRLVLANIVTAVVFVAGSLLSGRRLPLTIYFIGPVVQLFIVGLSRIGVKLVLMERDQVRMKSQAKINTMIVGIKHIGRNARRQVDHSGNMITKCVVDTMSEETGRLFDGVPVIGGTDQIREAIEKYSINYVLIADTYLNEGKRKEIREICDEKKIDVVDMTGFIENSTEVLPLTNLLRVVSGPVILKMNGKEEKFTGGEKVILSLTKHYVIKKISAEKQSIVIELTDNPLVPNDTSEEWVKDYEEETGSDVSFF